MYFRDRAHYTAECRVDANGRQYLLWMDESGPKGLGRPAMWLDTYKPLPNAIGDDWDNPRSRSSYSPKTPGNYSRIARKPSVRELSQRAGFANPAAADGTQCVRDIHVAVFFDGTNNNLERDRPEKGHSNVVTLYDAHEEDNEEFFRYYIPGVGTRFAAIGEEAESNSDGNTFAKGGEARIHFGMLQVYNAVCTAATQTDLLTAEEMKSLVTSYAGLHTLWRLGDDKTIRIFRALNSRLRKAVEGKRPSIGRVNVSVFGFSRGSAQARTFMQWMNLACGGNIGGAECSLRFLGIFDTVASVLLADSSPIGGNGFMDWADGTMDIRFVNRTAHFVAAHEIRRSFPLSTARTGAKWPAGVQEYVYPGAHSDVGGGYSPGDQGKAMGGRSSLLAQIPLNDMYHEALNAGVKVRQRAKFEAFVKQDFAIDPALDQAFGHYATWTARYDEKEDIVTAGGAPEDRMKYHTQLYWRWRAHIASDSAFRSLNSYVNSGAQDKTDLWEAELDWRRDIQAAREADIPRQDYDLMTGIPLPGEHSHASSLQLDILKQLELATQVPQGAGEFFDRYVHDSHAGFWVLGPRQKLEKQQLITEIKDKEKLHRQILLLAEKARKANLPDGDYLLIARDYELNQFERRVLAADSAKPGSLPVFSDADAAEFRRRTGFLTVATLKLMGTATRREASGHGRYRRIFDHA